MNIHRPTIIFSSFHSMVLALILLFTLSGESWAQPVKPKFPRKPVMMIVPYDAGGTLDSLGRILAEGMKKHLPQPLVVVNKPGAGGVVGMTELVNSPPDGYNLLLGVDSNLAMIMHILKVPYTIDDYVPVAQVAKNPSVLIVNGRAPWKDLKEFLAYAKGHPAEIRIGNAGNGTMSHLAAEQLGSLANVKFTHVPFTGVSPATTAVLGENVEAGSVYPQDAIPHVKGGGLRALTIFNDKRLKALEDVPILREAGYNLGWWGSIYTVVAPKNTPVEIVQILQDNFKKVLEDPGVRDPLGKLGLDVAYLSSQESGKHLRAWYNDSSQIVNQLGLGRKK